MDPRQISEAKISYLLENIVPIISQGGSRVFCSIWCIMDRFQTGFLPFVAGLFLAEKTYQDPRLKYSLIVHDNCELGLKTRPSSQLSWKSKSNCVSGPHLHWFLYLYEKGQVLLKLGFFHLLITSFKLYSCFVYIMLD